MSNSNEEKINTDQAINEISVIKTILSQEPSGGLLLTTQSQRGLWQILDRIEKGIKDLD